MPKFIKLKIKDVTQWRLVIDNYTDLQNYHELEVENNFHAFLSLNRKGNELVLPENPTIRAIGLQRILDARITSCPKGEKMYPFIEVAEITDSKLISMSKAINISPIQVNEAGGYCFLDSFIKTWDAEVLEEIEKKDFGFPIEDEILKTNTIILENSPTEKNSLLEGIIKEKIENIGVVKTIFNLKNIDIDYVFKCLQITSNIIIESQLMDDNQIDSFMKLFLNLEPKNIYLFLNEENVAKIKSHCLFVKNNNLHKIELC